jgi:hypothetical protein
MISYPEYEKIMRERALALHQQLTRALGEEAERRGVTEEMLFEELEEDKRAVFEEMYGKI